MKRLIAIIGVIIVIGLIAWGAWFFIISKKSSNSNPVSSLPTVAQVKTQSGATAPVQSIASPQNADVAKAFLGDIQNSNQIALGGTVVASPYAVQVWGDANQGGEALLENASSGGWTLISLGGGEWSELALLQEGVPISIAQQLIVGLGSGAAASSTGSSIAVPPGNTFTIGTPTGVVTVNNFYKSADYIDQGQGIVVVQQTSTYGIFYNTTDSDFTITIFGSSLDAERPIAEAGFLSQLGVSQGDACKLSVVENISANFNSPDAGKSFPLSFCNSGSSF